MTRRALLALVASAALAGALSALPVDAPRADLPRALSDREFWSLVGELSEPEGYFDSDNLVSNEETFQRVIPELARTVTHGGVYVGVGPDQNFPYILATSPSLAFITDIRRGNLLVHLMYKALIELSADRAEFLSRLFSRQRPPGLQASASARELFRAYRGVEPTDALFARNLAAVIDRLTAGHGFALSNADRDGIRDIYAHFHRGGPALRFVSSRGGNWYPTYEELQLATDAQGVNHGYLATEPAFARLKAMQHANLIVPIVGNFAGPHALRAVGAWVRARGGVVSTFYLSNVERYLFQDGAWRTFAANVATMPLDAQSTFIRSCFDSCPAPAGSRVVSLLDSMPGLLADVRAGRIATYYDVLRHSHGD